MTEVYRRKLALDIYTPTLTAETLFYSRIILKKLTTENPTTFRKLEKSVTLIFISVEKNLNEFFFKAYQIYEVKRGYFSCDCFI